MGKLQPFLRNLPFNLCCIATGLIKAGLLQQLFVGAARSGAAPSSTCAEYSRKTLTKKTEHIKPVLKNLHWLPVKDRIDHKILSLVYNCFSDTAQQDLQEPISRYEPPPSL